MILTYELQHHWLWQSSCWSGTLQHSPTLPPERQSGAVWVEMSCQGLQNLILFKTKMVYLASLFKTKMVHFATLFKTRDIISRPWFISFSLSFWLIANLYTPFETSGPKRHPTEDAKWWNRIPCLRLKLFFFFYFCTNSLLTPKRLLWEVRKNGEESLKRTRMPKRAVYIVVSASVRSSAILAVHTNEKWKFFYGHFSSMNITFICICLC